MKAKRRLVKSTRKPQRRLVRTRTAPSKKTKRPIEAPDHIHVVVRFLRATSKFWHRDGNKRLSPQGIPTLESRVAVAKSMILREIAESVERGEYLSTEMWEEYDDD